MGKEIRHWTEPIAKLAACQVGGRRILTNGPASLIFNGDEHSRDLDRLLYVQQRLLLYGVFPWV
jgi:hypothetical protein